MRTRTAKMFAGRHYVLAATARRDVLWLNPVKVSVRRRVLSDPWS